MLWSREYGTGGRQSIGGQTSFIAELQLLHGDFAEERPIAMPRLATFRRKIGVSWTLTNGATQSEARRNRGLQAARSRAQTYGTDCFAMARPMLMRLSAITPRPTQRFMPASPL